MLLLTDVHYFDSGGARAAGVTLHDWGDAEPAGTFTVPIAEVEPYASGQFFRRELPCLLRLCNSLTSTPELVVVDGHVWLGDRPGLGAHLHRAIGCPVVGVAKNAHVAGGVSPVLRGRSERPLYVSAIGLEPAQAVAAVRSMAGPHRLPAMLKRVDRLARCGV